MASRHWRTCDKCKAEIEITNQALALDGDEMWEWLYLNSQEYDLCPQCKGDYSELVEKWIKENQDGS